MSQPWAHPRSRGENVTPAATDVVEHGSSPLTRGKHLDRRPAVQTHGLIPAHAGKTGRWRLRSTIRGAHPRSRGENIQPAIDAIKGAGSSPLTRGKPKTGATLDGIGGLIPAHAGKTRAPPPARRRRPAHPRSRGENRSSRYAISTAAGSSPLTRGKHVLTHPPRARLGLIPAHAGKTRRTRDPLRYPRAHPRSRGENDGAVGHADSSEGSSPLTRGKRPRIDPA